MRYGFTPPQALTSATRAGPAWLGESDRYGGIAPGKASDLVLLAEDPLRGVSAIKFVHTAVLRGRVYDRAALDEMLADAKSKVAEWNLTSKMRSETTA